MKSQIIPGDIFPDIPIPPDDENEDEDDDKIKINEKTNLLLIYDDHKKEVEYKADNLYHLKNIMIGLLIVADENFKIPHTVKVLKPKWIRKYITKMSGKK